MILVDGSGIIHRYHRAMEANPKTTVDGVNVSATYGIAKYCLSLLDHRPAYMAVCLDSYGKKTFRHRLSPEYKANRSPMPDDMKRNVPFIHEVLTSLNIPVYVFEGYEADDIIGTVAQTGEKAGCKVFIVTIDKDLAQLITPNISILSGRTGQDSMIIDENEFELQNGFKPQQLVDYLALLGDKSDNIPGVNGIGKKRAGELIRQFGTIENIYNNMHLIASAKVREALRVGRDQLELSKKLTQINRNVPVEFSLNEMVVSEIDMFEAMPVFRKYEIEYLIKNK